MNKKIENLELRSEKVRNIIGEVPPELVRYGTGLVTFILLTLLLIAFVVPYKVSAQAKARVIQEENNYFVEIQMPYRYAGEVKAKMLVTLELEGYNPKTYAPVYAKIVAIDRSVKEMEGKSYFAVKAKIAANDSSVQLNENMKATAAILLSDQTIWEHLTSQSSR